MRNLLICCCMMVCSFVFGKDFVVGTSSGYAPYVSLNEQGELEGFDVDVAKEIAKRLDRKLILKDLGSLPSLFLSLQRGKIDAVIWAVSITEERKKQMDMTFYQGEEVTSLPLLFWKGIPEGVSSIEDLLQKKGKICVEAGSFQAHFLEKYPQEKIKQVTTLNDVLFEIKYGKSLATIVDPSLLIKLLEQFPDLQVMKVPLNNQERSLGNGICTMHEMTEEIQRIVKAMQDEGLIAILEKKWGLS